MNAGPRFRFVCRACGGHLRYRNRSRGYVHTDGRVCNGSTVAHEIRSIPVS